MSKEQENKTIIGRWFTGFRGPTCDLSIVDELAAPDMLLQYSLHEPRRGHADIKAFMTDSRAAFPDLSFARSAVSRNGPPYRRLSLKTARPRTKRFPGTVSGPSYILR
jgi:SnoaL-like polyketide cyclase